LAKHLKLKKEEVLVASTGIIGKRLPLIKIKRAIPKLVKGLSLIGIDKAKRAILTTDKFTKEITAKFDLKKGKIVTLCGIAKGAGMIAPNLATMLAFILTDANITEEALRRALKTSIDNSFNCISVDGCMSTNDSVLILANGASMGPLIASGKNFLLFSRALNLVCLELAKMIVRDAEGASKFIRIRVKGAKSQRQAKEAAWAVANSNLFKTAIYGENPNFGRIVSALGASSVEIKEEKLRIKFSPLSKKEINLDISLGMGKASAMVYTSDLTPEYVKINATYN
ncbi:MAG: bifunctional ornithine acetyltransferase/N-acetylglutamate synthase, partial [Candidatus Omnitrophica bacterium]|nr:bifunctional ornithine acetyltransferase/N-acetylglutamate synthase [Candidatus Omnitrophota bacterium]